MLASRVSAHALGWPPPPPGVQLTLRAGAETRAPRVSGWRAMKSSRSGRGERGRAPTHHSRAEADDRRVLGLGIDVAFVETVLEFCFVLGIKLGLVLLGRPEEGDSELWSDKSGLGGEIK